MLLSSKLVHISWYMHTFLRRLFIFFIYYLLVFLLRFAVFFITFYFCCNKNAKENLIPLELIPAQSFTLLVIIKLQNLYETRVPKCEMWEIKWVHELAEISNEVSTIQFSFNCSIIHNKLNIGKTNYNINLKTKILSNFLTPISLIKCETTVQISLHSLIKPKIVIVAIIRHY